MRISIDGHNVVVRTGGCGCRESLVSLVNEQLSRGEKVALLLQPVERCCAQIYHTDKVFAHG